MFLSYKIEKNITLECLHSLFEATYSSGFSFAGEAHDFWELVYVEHGNVCISADERIINLTEGEILFHKPMEFHKLYIENDNSASLLTMSFSASGSLLKRFKRGVFRLSSEQKKFVQQMLDFLHNDCELLLNYECLFELEKKPIHFQIFCCMLEYLLLSLSKDRMIIDVTEDNFEAQIYRKAVQTINNHITDWLSVPEIAKECNVSVSLLKKVFAKYIGFGVHTYYIKSKLTYASRMLKGGKSVAEISNTLSFSSPSYFSKVYKRHLGVSPLTYKSEK